MMLDLVTTQQMKDMKLWEEEEEEDDNKAKYKVKK
jgi:hypothetical protein